MKQRYLKKYTTKIINGIKKNILVTWTQRRCKICQRFLSMKQKLHCDRCRNRLDLEQGYRSNKNFGETQEGKEYYKLRNFVKYHSNEFNVGDMI